MATDTTTSQPSGEPEKFLGVCKHGWAGDPRYGDCPQCKKRREAKPEPSPDVAELVRRLERAHSVMAKLASTGTKSWRMTIPADPENDTDLIVCGALREAKAELDRLAAENAKLRETLLYCRSFFVNQDCGMIVNRINAALKETV